MKKGFFTLCLMLCSQGALANNMGNYGLNYLSVDFAAPVVGSKTALNSVPAGQLVYEQGTGFWGLTTAGGPGTAANWVQISGTAGGGVSSSGTGQTVNAATIANNGACSIGSQEGSWVSSVSHTALGRCQITFAVAYATTPFCVCSASGGNGDLCAVTVQGTGNITTYTGTTVTGVDEQYNVICMGK